MTNSHKKGEQNVRLFRLYQLSKLYFISTSLPLVDPRSVLRR